MKEKRSPNGQKIKLQILNLIRNTIYKSQWNQMIAAKIIGVDQPKVSQIINGKAAGFSLERLLLFLLRLNCDIQLSIRTKRCPLNLNIENAPLKADLDTINLTISSGDAH